MEAVIHSPAPSRISDNIPKSYVYSFVSSFGLTDAIWMLYLAHRGMSLLEIGLLESIFHLTSLVMEIPTGVVADRFGRRTSRILSRAVACSATLMMLASSDFPGFAFAFVLTALGHNLESGAGDALVYDSLVDLGREGEYMKVKGRQEIGYQSAHGLSLVAGGAVATFDYNLAYLLTAGIHLASLGLALGFSEPLAGRAPQGSRRPSLLIHIQVSISIIRSNSTIFIYILFLETFSLFYTTLYFWFQTFLKSEGWLEWSIGLTLGASSAAAVLMATQAHRIEALAGRKAVVGTAPFLAMAFFGLIAVPTGSPAGLAGSSAIPAACAIVALSAIEGFLFVTFSDYINRLIPSENRATLLSFQAMIFSVMMIIFFPAMGALASAFGYRKAFAAVFAASVPVLLATRAWLLGDIRRSQGSN
ncbi:MAG: MFS transporter [Rectinemataceae bacterium]